VNVKWRERTAWFVLAIHRVNDVSYSHADWMSFERKRNEIRSDAQSGKREKKGKFRPIFLNDIPALPRTSDSITKMSSRGPCRRAGKTRPITGQRSARPATCAELTGWRMRLRPRGGVAALGVSSRPRRVAWSSGPWGVKRRAETRGHSAVDSFSRCEREVNFLTPSAPVPLSHSPADGLVSASLCSSFLTAWPV
jgi:hypothetical protein